MNPNIKAAAANRYPRKDWADFPGDLIGHEAFIKGATYFQQSSGADEMAEALMDFLNIKTKKSIMAQIGIVNQAETALAKYLSFIKKEEA